MKVFVTGATGFVTGNVTMQLLARGDQVRALVRDASRGRTLERAGATAVAGDLSDAGALRRGMDGRGRRGARRGDLRGGYPAAPTARDVRSERPRHAARPRSRSGRRRPSRRLRLDLRDLREHSRRDRGRDVHAQRPLHVVLRGDQGARARDRAGPRGARPRLSRSRSPAACTDQGDTSASVV